MRSKDIKLLHLSCWTNYVSFIIVNYLTTHSRTPGRKSLSSGWNSVRKTNFFAYVHGAVRVSSCKPSLLVSFCQLFKLPLVVHCCNVICEWPLNANVNVFKFSFPCKTIKYKAAGEKYYSISFSVLSKYFLETGWRLFNTKSAVSSSRSRENVENYI